MLSHMVKSGFILSHRYLDGTGGTSSQTNAVWQLSGACDGSAKVGTNQFAIRFFGIDPDISSALKNFISSVFSLPKYPMKHL